MESVVCCSRCKKEITTLDGVDYSQEDNAVLCSYNCAVDYYFDVMRSIPLEYVIDEIEGMKFIDGKLRQVNND